MGKQLLSQLGVAVVSKLIPLASIFVYSRYMSVADYGLLNLSQSYLWIFVLLMTLNLHVAIGRYIYEPGAAKSPFLGTTLCVAGGLFFLGCAVVYLASDLLVDLLNLPLAAIFLILLIVLGMVSESILTQLAISDKRGGMLLISIATKAALSFVGCLVLLHVLATDKYMAILLAEACAGVGLCIYVAYSLSDRVEWTVRLADIKYMTAYALPLVPYMLSLTLVSQFDRVLLDKFYGSEITGYYSIGYNFGALLAMAASAALNAMTPAFFDALNKKDFVRLKRDSDAIFNFSVVAASGIVLFGMDAALIVLPDRYREGFGLIPLIALGGLCSVVFQVWVRVLAFQHRTAVISAIGVFGAILSVGLNAWFLPRAGYEAAGYVALATHVMMSLACVVVVNSVSGVRVSLIRETKWVAFIALLLPVAQLEHTVLLYLVKLTLFCGCFWVLRHSLTAFMPRAVM